jgi:acylphosphatase
MNATRHLRISGRVQGVGYREGLRREALAHDVTGWVRNRRDGTVEAVIEGEAAGIERMLAWARQGPPGSSVSQVTVEEAVGGFAGFDILPSA